MLFRSLEQAGDLEHLNLHSMQLSGTLPPEWGRLKHLEKLSLYGNKISGSLPIGFLERMQDLKSCELTKATTDALEWNTNQFYCAADVHETFASYPAACVPLQYQICAADYWIAQLAGAAVGTLLVLGLLVFCAKKARDNYIRKRSKLLNEVTSTSATVLSDLSDRKAGAPVVIVDGKSMGLAKATDSSDPRHCDE